MSYAVTLVALVAMLAIYVAIPEAHNASASRVVFTDHPHIAPLIRPGYPDHSAVCPNFTTFHDWTDDDGRREHSQCYEEI
jgi:hypothetical protein